MSHWQHDVRSLLRPSEHVHLILEGTSSPEKDLSQAATQASLSEINLASSEEWGVVLAVVGHVEQASGETGSVFIYKDETASSMTTHRSSLTLQHAFPIHGDFSLSISQLAPSSTDETDEPSTPKSPTVSAENGFSIEVSESNRSFTFTTHDKEHLSSAVLACRRLRDLSLRNSIQREAYQWLDPYTLHPNSWLSAMPPLDIRQTRRPVYSRLSLGCAGMPGDEVNDFFTIRDHWLHTEAKSAAPRDPERTRLRIRTGTFNVNGKVPSQDLSTWLGGGPLFLSEQEDEWERLIPPLKELSPLSLGDSNKPPSGTDAEKEEVESPTPSVVPLDPDLLVIALQEIDLSTEALLYSKKTTREDAWTVAVLAGLGEKAELYEKLTSKQLVGILLIVFVKKDLRSCFTGIRANSVGAGIMGVMGNKGAVAVRLTYKPRPTTVTPSPAPITLTFVNSHLAAFEDQFERRNADFRDISRRLEFGPCPEYMWTPPTEDAGFTARHRHHSVTDCLVPGRSKYRINLPDADVRHLLGLDPVFEGVPTLLQFDQLKSAIRKSKAFIDFEEYPITFFPTYRFNADVVADTLGYDIKRKPAWTDRILHMSSPSVKVRQRSYSAHPAITMSDHRPVSADFVVDVPCVDSMALDTAAHNLYKSVAAFDPEDPSSPPVLKLDKSTLDFGKVSYSVPTSQSLKIRNVGKVPAAFRFFPRDLSSPVHPNWLKIEPMTGFLLPEQEATLEFTIYVSPKIAAPLNLKTQELFTLIIVHTALGQDLFLSVSGEYEPTCFGTSLATLVRLPGPIRELKGEEELIPSTQARNSSREFMKLMGWLMSSDIDAIDDLFVVPGDAALVSQIRESLDTGAELPPPFPEPPAPQTVDMAYARGVASALLAFLRALPDPVIPTALHARCAEVDSRDAAFEILSLLPSVSVNVWISVTALLHLLVLKSEQQADTQHEKRFLLFFMEGP
ncbi:Endonuclease/exonuclease/phosphatase [Gloeopeniophorella convolvens]|nr:Endonuclease/exonuclease/phosphatase [Gloeopeniophorella convolvens]